MYILNVAEKPSVAKALSDMLSNGRTQSSSGCNKYCRVFKFKCKVFGAPADMIFTSVLGHLYMLEFEKKTLWTEIDPIRLFEEKVRWAIPEAMQGVSKTITNLSLQCKMLIIWTDCDREGENIGMQIASLVQSQISKIKRARFSGLSRYEVFRALENLGSLNANESAAVDSRIEIDLRIGAAITRLQTLQLQTILEKKSVISYGSCQIPTLGFVCEREESIENFVEEETWTLCAEVQNARKKRDFLWNRGILYDKIYVSAKMDSIVHGQLVVSKHEKKKVQKYRPVPLRTVELQKFFAKGRKISSSHELMNIAEALYTSGYISYPRTETDVFPNTFNYKEPLENLKQDPVLQDYASHLVPGNPSAGKHNDQAHTPIYPLKAGSSLKEKERLVFEYVARRFLACYSENAEGEEELIECTVNGEVFASKALRVLKKNYLEVFIYEKWENTGVDIGVSLGQSVDWSVSMKESKTVKPHLITEAELITKMDSNGIGTDATIHDHIQRIKKREYIYVVNSNSLKSTWIGRSLVNGYKCIDLAVCEPFLRKDFECNLKKVCSGELAPAVLVQQELKKYKDIYIEIEKNILMFKSEFVKNKQSLGGSGDGAASGLALNAEKNADTALFENTAPSKDACMSGFPKKTLKNACASVRKGSSFLHKMHKLHSKPKLDNVYVKKKKNQKEDALSQEAVGKKPYVCFYAMDKPDHRSENMQLLNAAVTCHCNIAAKEAVVKKEGLTKGKLFFSCKAGQCDYFVWKDAASVSGAPARTAVLKKDLPGSKERAALNLANTDIIKCECGIFAKYFLSKTAKNNNRGFFKCNKSYKPCQFFKWEDEIKKDPASKL